MRDTFREIRSKMDELEQQLRQELAAKQEEFRYTVEKKKVRFSREVQEAHRALVTRWTAYAYESGVFKVLTIPIIWFALVPAVFLDFFVGLYQLICFPIYGIPMVRRSDHIVLDRHRLRYLNWVEKCNCIYCGYFNGLMAYVREIAGRTEQYWCPIRHSRLPKSTHSRYDRFVDYGDAEGYRRELGNIRKDFDDCRKD
ncbi:hypothetical protein [Desulfomicrobium escambiense]|uniref:hypothetical protein n=1 Tax=Desulfomicrobium escambiense TaxID=29503 RepID=UPI00042911B2|nr:hypothetical protein [Desulfomicrobium escambiense]